jgi:hypothetical protein
LILRIRYPMLNKLKEGSALLILYVWSIYTFAVVVSTDILYTNRHYVGFLVLFISTAAFFVKGDLGPIITLVALLIGVFANAAIAPSEYYLGIGSLKISWPYVLILIAFLVINFKNVPAWLQYALKEENSALIVSDLPYIKWIGLVFVCVC